MIAVLEFPDAARWRTWLAGQAEIDSARRVASGRKIHP
jgi:hypothetical protein